MQEQRRLNSATIDFCDEQLRLVGAGRIHLIFNPRLLVRAPRRTSPFSVLLNFEQFWPSLVDISFGVLDLFRAYPVLDMSRGNMAVLHKMDVPSVVGVFPHGYMPVMEDVPRLSIEPKDIDVLFIGAASERRLSVFDHLRLHHGLDVAHVTGGVFGTLRQQLIARAKVVLHVHQFEAHQQQAFIPLRLIYLLANRAAVVAERGSDRSMEDEWDGAIAFAPLEELAAVVRMYLEDTVMRQALAERGYDAVRQRRLSTQLMPTLEWLQSRLDRVTCEAQGQCSGQWWVARD